jgi:hypothetical protein
MCEEFPQFSQFKALEIFVLERLNKLRSLGSHSSFAAFPALKNLTLYKLKFFESWVATEGEELTFPLLENVEINNCPKLTTLPEAPKLKVIDLEEDKAQLSLSIFRSRYMSCLSELFLSISDTEATPALKLDQDYEVSLSVIKLDGCNFLFPSSPTGPAVGVWKCFGQLMELHIKFCDMLVYWPEEEFRSLVLLKNLYISFCSKLIGPTKVKGYRTIGRDQLLPNLKNLGIVGCRSLTKLFVLPQSLTSISICSCDSLAFIPGQDGSAVSSGHCNDLAYTSMPEQSPSPRINTLPCLEYLEIRYCMELRLVSVQLDTLLYLDITACNGLESLNCLGDLRSVNI